ncbi:class I SAM-dependent methyltransferase [Maribacter sp. 2307UL18-2]|uniref:class I SAM-dependent methyltransferase n=1 Tax=Maribacter sp. 2307UL18-2 TaxID=3386274 RepID=UPI0039BD4CB1
MSEAYSKITAGHYAAFRPSLHAPILERCIEEGERFGTGLDVGCGTGRSTIALADYCDSVIGIDPSSAMLDTAIQNPKIKYLNAILEESDLGSDSYDIITFAGVLFYSKSQDLYNEVVRLSKKGAPVIVYDFEVVLKAFDTILDLGNTENVGPPYDHAVNFAGLLDGRLDLKIEEKEVVDLSVSSSELAHLILAEESSYRKLASRFGSDEVFESVQRILDTASMGTALHVQANIFYSIYVNTK